MADDLPYRDRLRARMVDIAEISKSRPNQPTPNPLNGL